LPRVVVAVTPIVGGKAIKGPAAKMMAELGLQVSAGAVAAYYGNLIDGFIFDQQDAHNIPALDCAALTCDTIMLNETDRGRLAVDVLQFALGIANYK